MKTESIDEMKKLMIFSKASGTFWNQYDKKTTKAQCDKYDARFLGDTRWTLFRYERPITFDSYVGYYGNSSRSLFGSGVYFGDELIKKYLPLALNSLKREIFEQMSIIAAKDAKAISDKAEKEIAALQQILQEAKQESTEDEAGE